MNRIVLVWVAVWTAAVQSVPAADGHPLTEEKRAAMRQQFEQSIADATAALARNPQDRQAYSRRGDAHFFRGDFAKALTDYDRMVELDPEQEASHWRRGIAQFYAGNYEDAQRQFEAYRTYDDRDPETHYWLFLSQAKANGLETARRTLERNHDLNDDETPTGFLLFAGRATPEQMLDEIRAADLTERQRERALFYAHLYIGLNAALQDQTDLARRYLRRAIENTWVPQAGYGPTYMWHVARLHYDRLNSPPSNAAAP